MPPSRGRFPRGKRVDHTIELIALWDRAATSPYGIKIRSERTHTLWTYLYKARQGLSRADYDHFRVLFDETHVWIVPRIR